jgi:hypothetical protein
MIQSVYSNNPISVKKQGNPNGLPDFGTDTTLANVFKQNQFPKPPITNDTTFDVSSLNPKPILSAEKIRNNNLAAQDKKVYDAYQDNPTSENIISIDDKDLNDETKKGTGTGPNTADYIASGIQVLGSVYNTASTTASTEKESTMNVLSSMATGAQVGATIGGPWGAAIGGAAMGIYAGIDAVEDKKRFAKRQNQMQTTMLTKTTADRLRNQKIEDGQVQYGKLKALYQADLGIV